MRMIKKLTSVVLLSLLVTPVGSSPAAFNLLSKSEERKVGSKVVEDVRKEFPFDDDPYLMAYVNRIGRRLESALGSTQFDMDFHVVADSDINAFAVPGGHIFITSQTILLCDDESELAGVIAHEMGHVQGRHMAHQMESGTKLSLAAMAAVLAGAFLGRNSAVGPGLATFALAGAQTKMLQYSRADEEDADRRGLRTLLAAGYDGWGMVRFMKMVEQQLPSPEGVPAYLFTHPLPENRVEYLSQMLPPEKPRPKDVARLGPLWRAQARILSQDPRPWGMEMFEKRVKDHPKSPDARLGLAVLLKERGRYDEALAQLDAAQSLAPADAEIEHERAAIWLRQGRKADAIALLEDMRAKGTATAPALGELAWTYVDSDQGQKALAVIEDLTRRFGHDRALPKLDYYRGLALGKVGREGEGHAYLGDYYAAQGDHSLALRHYRDALRLLPQGPLHDQVTTKLKALSSNES